MQRKKFSITNTSDLKSRTEESEDIDEPVWKFWKRRRYVVACLAFFGFFNAYAMRVNMSIAIVAMTENKAVTLENGTVTYMREFEWDSKQQGFVLSSFFYGYITTQLLGGILGARYGGNIVFGLGIAATTILTLLTPWLAITDFYLLLAARIIEGVFEGVTYPCIHTIWSKWAPPLERSRMATIAFSGSFVGTVVSMPLCAYFAKELGWPSIFYFFGCVGILWSIIWFLTVSRSPELDKHISNQELLYIQRSLENISSDTELKYPWKSIFTSVPFWANVVAHFSETWGFYTLVTQLPKFMKEALGFNLEKTGLMSALPYIAKSITIQISGYLADWLQIKKILTTTQVRKIFTCFAYIGQACFWVTAAYWLHPIGTPLCLTIGVGIGAFGWAGFSVNYLDIAPQYAGVLMGIGNTVGTLPGIISPIVTGYIVTTPAPSEWQIVFYIASAIYISGCIVYAILASGELQPWAGAPEKVSDYAMEEKKPEYNHDNNKSVLEP